MYESQTRGGRSIWLCLTAAVLAVFVLSSCGTTRPYTYMQGSFDTAKLSLIEPFDPKIKKGDLLSIVVFSANPQASAYYNQGVSPSSGSGQGLGQKESSAAAGVGTAGASASTQASGPNYLVDESGNITFPNVGVLHVETLSRAQLTDTMNARLGPFLTAPYCNVRFANYKFRMLGEVGKPGEFNIPGEQINVLEAIALAGDLTFYARRDNVLVIREKDGKRVFGRLDLTRPEIMSSPFFYIQQNDLVIVEQNKKKSIANDQATLRNISIATSIVTLLAVIYSIFKK